MSVAKCLGIDDPTGPALTAAARAWARWCHRDPDLAVVDDLDDLPSWTRVASRPNADALLATLHRMAQDDAEAATVLAWLLVPGATTIAGRLADLSMEVDALVAGALWIRVRAAAAPQHVATTILRDVRRMVLGDLGVGDAARRADPAWARTTTHGGTSHLPEGEAPWGDPAFEADLLIQAAVVERVITTFEARLLLELAQTADALGVSSRRGRAGLTAPAVIEAVTDYRPESGRTIRRRVATALERLARFAVDRRLDQEVRDYITTYELPPGEATDFLEYWVWEHIEEYLEETHREAGP